jgi:choline dehydrogenase-like flavoprotein
MGESALAGRIIARLQASGFPAEAGSFAVDDAPLAPGRLSAGIASGLGLFFRHAGAAVVSGKLRVATGVLVTRLQVSGARATGVVAEANGSEAEIPARTVVLAAGGIESIKLAALSGVPDPHERIGKGLQEHIFYHGLFSSPELYDGVQPDAAVVYVRAPTQDSHQWELHAPGERLFALDDGSQWEPGPSAPYHVMVRSFAATEKRDENFVEPREGPRGSSLIHFSHSAADESSQESILDRAPRLAKALNLQPTDAEGVDGQGRFRPPGSSYHEAGGLDMGTDPRTSVTDGDGRFHTVPSLICADAAAFPRIGATNPHLTIVAVAHRKAEALARSLS